MILLIILIIATIANIVWVVWAFNKAGDGEVFTTSIMILIVVVGLIGWLILGITVETGTRISDVDNSYIEIVRTPQSMIVIDFDHNDYYNFDTKVDFDYISDSTTFYYDECLNMYNGVTERNLIYYTYFDTIVRADTIRVRELKIKREGKKI